MFLLFPKEHFALYTVESIADELLANVASTGNSTFSCYTVNNSGPSNYCSVKLKNII